MTRVLKPKSNYRPPRTAPSPKTAGLKKDKMTEEEQNEELMDEAARWYYSEIMRQLIDSERFCNWFQMNFDVHKLINEEEKSIEIRVMEVPPELVQARMEDQMIEEMKRRQKEDSGIVLADAGDLKAIEDAARKKR